MKRAPKPQLVKDFAPRFRRRVSLAIVAFQLVSLAITAVLLYYAGIFGEQPTIFAAILATQGLAGLVMSFLIYGLVSVPIKSILAALVHISGEPTTTTPPNPNQKSFERNGLKPVLQTIYQLSSGSKILANQEPKADNDGQTILEAAAAIPKPTEPQDQSLLGAALDQAICGLAVFNQQRKIIYASKATPVKVDTSGVQSLDLIFQENDSLEKWWDECEQSAVHAERTWPRIPSKLPNDENRRFFDVIASYSKGAQSEMVLTLIDRTRLYEVGEEELDFIAFAAHELRGPITVIRGYIDVLADELSETLQEDQKELFRRLAVSANRLTGYVNNILNTSRYDRRHLRMHLDETTYAAVYGTISDDMSLRASSQNRILNVNIPEDLPTIAADTASLSEVFSNLIDNAIKYSNEGGVIAVAAQTKGDFVELSVEDHGIGMPSSVMSNLFQKFYRSHRSRETVAGTGIGLYISKAIVESHGGTISVRSEDGLGSTFTISLPKYKMVADKLRAGDNVNEGVMNNSAANWIKNHTMYRG